MFYYLLITEITIGTYLDPFFVYQEFMFKIASLFDAVHLTLLAVPEEDNEIF